MVSCIFCGTTFAPTGVGEHIIPDCVGGSIVIKEVCIDCNNKLNQTVDEHFCTQFVTELLRDSHDIKGKRKKDKANPFSEVARTDKNYKVRLGTNFKPEVITNTATSDHGDYTKVRIIIDKDSINDVEKILFSACP